MIKQTIDQDIKSAMLAGDKPLVEALKTVKSAILYAEVAAKKREEGLAEPEVVAILQKELKKRGEAAQLYDQGGNAEQAASERYEETVIQKYLPAQLDEAAINVLIDQAVAEYNGELNGQAMGKLIGAVKQKAGGAADGALVARLVKARLSL
ncbi:MAG: GatB/YqeY domain-containing protein [Candidatus Saccharimonadales bacterium]